MITQLHISDKTSRHFSDGSVAKLQNNCIETAGNHSQAQGNMEGIWAWDHVSVTTKWEAFKETLQYFTHIYGNRGACCDETWTCLTLLATKWDNIAVSSCGCGDRSRCFKPKHDVFWPDPSIQPSAQSIKQLSWGLCRCEGRADQSMCVAVVVNRAPVRPRVLLGGESLQTALWSVCTARHLTHCLWGSVSENDDLWPRSRINSHVKLIKTKWRRSAAVCR